jgi:hypothetical protein
MNDLIPALLIKCFQYFPQYDKDTIDLGNNITYPLYDQAVHQQRRLNELFQLSKVNKQWNKLLREESKCYNNCIWIQRYGRIDFNSLIATYPSLAHLDCYASDPYSDEKADWAVFDHVTILDLRGIHSSRLDRLATIAAAKVKKLSIIIWG